MFINKSCYLNRWFHHIYFSSCEISQKCSPLETLKWFSNIVQSITLEKNAESAENVKIFTQGENVQDSLSVNCPISEGREDCEVVLEPNLTFKFCHFFFILSALYQYCVSWTCFRLIAPKKLKTKKLPRIQSKFCQLNLFSFWAVTW